MDKSIINKKTCENCRYYAQHYIKTLQRYDSIFCGHCLNKNIKRHKLCPNENCKHWEDVSILKEQRKQSIKKTVEFMCERLNEMVMLLKEDEE